VRRAEYKSGKRRDAEVVAATREQEGFQNGSRAMERQKRTWDGGLAG
jgi:hypothetical protein